MVAKQKKTRLSLFFLSLPPFFLRFSNCEGASEREREQSRLSTRSSRNPHSSHPPQKKKENTMPRTGLINGCTYMYTTNGRPIRFKLLRFDPVSKSHVVTSNGRGEWHINLHQMGSRVRRVRSVSKKMDTSTVYLYMCNVGENTYKVGATCAPDRRCKQIRTYTSVARMKSVVRIPAAKGSEWAKLEKAVLRRFAAHRPANGGKEVLKMTQAQAHACAGYMRAVCR